MTALQIVADQTKFDQGVHQLAFGPTTHEPKRSKASLTKLTDEAQKIEPEIRAAIVAEPDPDTTITNTGDPEQRERLELRSKTGLADFLSAAAGGREVTRELRKNMRISRLFAAEQTAPGYLPRRSTGDPCYHDWTGG